MERRDDTERTAEKAAAQRALNEHPADSQQVNEGFETGYDQVRDTPEERRGSNFARGNSDEVAPGTERKGRFSTGEETLPEDDPENTVQRRFSEGIEERPKSK
jgi:hypothetical protein